jgi:hypothetical protein
MSMTYPAAASREDRVRHVAHLIWEDEGRPDGRAENHWLAAEAKLSEVDAIEAPARKASTRTVAVKRKLKG